MLTNDRPPSGDTCVAMLVSRIRAGSKRLEQAHNAADLRPTAWRNCHHSGFFARLA
jgi:hypothetical protein